MRKLLVGFVVALSGCSTSSSDSTICPGFAAVSNIKVTRELNVAFADADKLTFSLCINGACRYETRTGPGTSTEIPFGKFGDDVMGTLSPGSAAGKTAMAATMRVGAGPINGTSNVGVLVRTTSAAEVLRVTGTVMWDDGECHTSALTESL